MTTSATDPDEELRVLIQKLARRIRNERGGEGITDSQLGVLWLLTSEGRSTPGQLADRERVSAPAMNRTINALESAGLVARRARDERRGRTVRVGGAHRRG